MNSLQLELPLFEQPKNLIASQKSGLMHRKRPKPASSFKTQEVLRLLKLEKANSALRAARARNGAYRQDNYVVVHIAHDKWEVFRRCSARAISA